MKNESALEKKLLKIENLINYYNELNENEFIKAKKRGLKMVSLI